MEFLDLVIGVIVILLWVLAEIVFHGLLETILSWCWPMLFGLIIAIGIILNNHFFCGITIIIVSIIGQVLWVLKRRSGND